MNIIYVPHKYPCDPLLCLPPSLPPSLIHPQEKLICFLSYYFAFVEFSMTVITQYIVFVWLLSFSIIIKRFTHVGYINSLFLFIAKEYRNIPNLFPVWGYYRLFQIELLWTFMYKTLHRLSLQQMPSGEMAESGGICMFNSLINSNCFPTHFFNLHSHQQYMIVPDASLHKNF